MKFTRPRLLIAGLRGGSGKTTLTTGLVAALRKRAWTVVSFKKGPDYIDAAWLGLASGRPCRNLDTWMMGDAPAFNSFVANSDASSISIIEGNRGLFDGSDADGGHSSAALARLLQAPVALIADCAKTTRTMAALIAGCANFEPGLNLAGVVLNQVAGARHEKMLRDTIEKYAGVPVIGAIPRDDTLPFRMRHLGLVPPQEQEGADEAIAKCAELVERSVDIDRLMSIANAAPALEAESAEIFAGVETSGVKLRVGVVRDSAFHFYYPENIDALRAAGAEIVWISAIADAALPEVDALYIGGGFPETQAAALADNAGFRASLKTAIADGLPVYAECGGAMYLGEYLVYKNEVYPMVGAIPAVFGLSGRPKGHGYSTIEVTAENPFFPVGHKLRGHEFHYSHVQKWTSAPRAAMIVKRGYGFDGSVEGVCAGNAMATFTHAHAVGEPLWAAGIIAAAAARAKTKVQTRHCLAGNI